MCNWLSWPYPNNWHVFGLIVCRDIVVLDRNTIIIIILIVQLLRIMIYSPSLTPFLLHLPPTLPAFIPCTSLSNLSPYLSSCLLPFLLSLTQSLPVFLLPSLPLYYPFLHPSLSTPSFPLIDLHTSTKCYCILCAERKTMCERFCVLLMTSWLPGFARLRSGSLPPSLRTCVPNLVAVRLSCRKKGGTHTHTHAHAHAHAHTHTHKGTLQLYIVEHGGISIVVHCSHFLVENCVLLQ